MKDYKTPKKVKLQMFYKSIEAVLDHFEDKECGTIFRAAFNYEMYGGQRPQMSDLSQQIVVDRLCDDFDNLLDAYLKKCEKNRDNANSRWNSEKGSKKAQLSVDEATEIANEMMTNYSSRSEIISEISSLNLSPADKALIKSLINKN